MVKSKVVGRVTALAGWSTSTFSVGISISKYSFSLDLAFAWIAVEW